MPTDPASLPTPLQVGDRVRVIRGLDKDARRFSFTVRAIVGPTANIDNGAPTLPFAESGFSLAAIVPLRDLQRDAGPPRLSPRAQVLLARQEERDLVEARVRSLEAQLGALLQDRHRALAADPSVPSAFSLLSVLRHSAAAIRHLFDAHDCDVDGWEVWREAGIAAARMADVLEGAPDAPPPAEDTAPVVCPFCKKGLVTEGYEGHVRRGTRVAAFQGTWSVCPDKCIDHDGQPYATSMVHWKANQAAERAAWRAAFQEELPDLQPTPSRTPSS